MKKATMLYSNTLSGLNKEIETFKVEEDIKPIEVKKILQKNGNYTAVIIYHAKPRRPNVTTLSHFG
ncbi:hypothetical protein [Globicatella sp. PHS-GS-PNBC-21-1553]|uniref:hypothetical protein n=1 Tax=Globicatella sp. PHS-GS-PNBC-21-1553 TaxID=2885764 RepID=UPI00298F21E0|nr:hypothetical protein [Globicatella sp. PHS-GS-PNBC-21-1553]WPC08799.1 hypothetical protein LB888_00640 [Globicatella sp. PHS-GS-PNBC-21-1553]